MPRCLEALVRAFCVSTALVTEARARHAHKCHRPSDTRALACITGCIGMHVHRNCRTVGTVRPRTIDERARVREGAVKLNVNVKVST